MLADDSDMTGQIAIPVVTMHAIDDPTAMVEQEAHYRAVVEKAGHGDLLVQTFTDEHVHSKLHDAEYPAMLNALMQWITTGQKPTPAGIAASRSEEHTSELQSLMRISYAVFCLKKKNTKHQQSNYDRFKNRTIDTNIPQQNQ